ncbi:fructose-6-phosphate aldolase [Clostridium sp. Cult2]|uniref:fructose-6-phosphate aldolase n=1 Tax=Clostridium sp. Cult2 TaxID=2079003 RepID=UPI001F0046A5|nr:fructose-6-phosphate aldolase [Clostridium sp. Cult2]MCF6466174.1 fructose-6-phosphate aldolase [Clostridium sp. Cult2]
MLILLDTADINDIKKGNEYYPIEGVTTNPTIIAKENRNYIEVLKDIRNIIGNDKMLHVQVLGTKAEDMVKEAHFIKDTIGGNIYIKIPVIEEGIKAIKALKKEGFNITATAIFTPQQALVAAMAGANFVAPYVNRLDNISADGVNVVKEISKLLNIHGLGTKILAASFKNVEQVHKSSLEGAHSVTLSLEILEKLIYHPLTDSSVENFIKDWKTAYNQTQIGL